MSGTALDHRLVRQYLAELDAAMRGLPAQQARELREQIRSHLDEALRPDADDQEVAATLSRLGSPADLAAEAGAGAAGPGRPAGSRPLRVFWTSVICLQPGESSGIDQLYLRVRVGWFTRTEVIPQQAWYLRGPSHGRCV